MAKEKEETEAVQEVNKDEYNVGQVATEHKLVIYKGEEQYDVHQALAKIMNDIEIIKKSVG